VDGGGSASFAVALRPTGPTSDSGSPPFLKLASTRGAHTPTVTVTSSRQPAPPIGTPVRAGIDYPRGSHYPSVRYLLDLVGELNQRFVRCF